MQFYHEIITQKSYGYLQELRGKYDFVLIGGWAVFLHTRALKSKDIDMIVDYPQLAKIKESDAVLKNERLKKYEIKTGEFDVDIYLDDYSDLGASVAQIRENTISKEGFTVPGAEMLLLLKLHAWQNRLGSAKGRKDELDIFSLANLPQFDWENYKRLVDKCGFGAQNRQFMELLKKTKSIKELAISEHGMAKLKKGILARLAA
ncbi:MAG: hypothetical protein WA093_04280 [Minisyncoccales bacterium]